MGNRVVLAVVGAVVCSAVVVGGVVAPSWAEAAEGPGASEPTLLGGFSLGDQIEAMVDPRSGAFSFALPVAGVSVAWSSSAAAVDRSGLGEGWSIAGVAQVDTEGGVRVSPASGGVYAANGSVPSGLDGYLLGDVVFRQGVTTVPARADGLRPAVEAAFELVELGGVRTFFSAAGDPLVRLDANGNRSEWEWQAGHRLVRAMDASGVVTTLDWSDPAKVRVTSAVGSSRSVSGAIELDGGRLAAVTDATGGRVHLGYSDAGLVNRIAGVSGAATEVTWQGLADGQVVVDGVRVVDAETGDELSSRRWSAQTGLASGWPAQGLPVGASAADRGGYATALTDGASTIVSEFDANHLLLEREVEVTTRTGSLVVQRQAYTYPEVDGDAKLPPQYGQPTGVTLTHLDAAGGMREVSEAFEFDAFGRLIGQVSQDGTRTDTRYDSEVPEGAELPMGLPISQRTTTPDGLVTETTHELNPNRTAHVATETAAGTTRDAELTRTARKEYDVEPDGFVSQERLYPQGGAGVPVVTTHTTDTDLVAGTATTSTTVAAGTAVAATSSRVVDLLLGVSLQESGPAGSVVSAVYDDAGRPVEQIDAGGRVTRIEHRTRQQHGQNATIVTRPDEVVTTTTTDVLGRVVTGVDPEPRYNKYHYADLNPIMLADPTGRFPELPFWASAVIAGVGLLMAAVGLFGTGIGAYMTAAATTATASPTIGSMLALGAVAAVFTFDAVAATLDTVHVFEPEFMDDDTAFILGAASAALGGVTMFVSAATRAIGRIDINKVMALGTSERSAESIVRVERRLVDRIARHYRKLGVELDESRLRSTLNKWAVGESTAGNRAWDAKSHYLTLKDFELGLDRTYHAGTIRFAVDSMTPVNWIAPSIGRKLTAMKNAWAFRNVWPEMDLTGELVVARSNLGRELESVVDVNTGMHVYPLGYRKAALRWDDGSYAGGSFRDDNFFGSVGESNVNGMWHHEVK
ncbi:hypothetical protein [Agromyces silvae]|uniref:hypothetical protein n=1 Tax=Agromyces silvae TaxID=3388266 RepID=UPI00280BCF25|nr:hypothetical protein [Agromyces protaetiae]